MNKTTIALKLAEEALLKYQSMLGLTNNQQDTKALAAIRDALAEQEKQEPVGVVKPSEEWGVAGVLIAGLPIGTKLYAAPVSAPKQENQEPVATVMRSEDDSLIFTPLYDFYVVNDMGLYAAPVSAKVQVDLTDDEVWDATNKCSNKLDIARALIAAYKEKNK